MFWLSHRRIFTLTTLLVIPALCTVLAIFSTVSEAGESIPFNYTASGTFESQPGFSFFPDGNEGGSITLQGTSSFGPVTVQEWAAGSGVTAGPCTPPGGKPNSGTEYPYSDVIGVITFKATGDVLVQNLVSGEECISNTPPSPPPPASFDGTIILNNIGGTGKFAGATGTETLHFRGQYLSCGDNGCVGYVHHLETGMVMTP
jgi:hypothetical protein